MEVMENANGNWKPILSCVQFTTCQWHWLLHFLPVDNVLAETTFPVVYWFCTIYFFQDVDKLVILESSMPSFFPPVCLRQEFENVVFYDEITSRSNFILGVFTTEKLLGTMYFMCSGCSIEVEYR